MEQRYKENKKPKNRKKAETLIETLIGMLIVSLGSVILMTAISSSLKVNKEIKEYNEKYEFTYQPVKVDETNTMKLTLHIVNDAGIDTPADVYLRNYKYTDPSGFVWYEKRSSTTSPRPLVIVESGEEEPSTEETGESE